MLYDNPKIMVEDLKMPLDDDTGQPIEMEKIFFKYHLKARKITNEFKDPPLR